MQYITEYNHDWPDRFVQIAGYLNEYLPEKCTIHHVGSTSVPGMPAKDIIDLDVEYAPGYLVTVIDGLQRAGYAHQGDLGISGREAFKPLPNSKAVSLPFHHLYACETGAFELRKNLAFRDYLRAIPARSEWLAHQKIAADASASSRSEYISIKSSSYGLITAESLEWIDKRLHWLPTKNLDVRFRLAERDDAEGLHENVFQGKSLSKVTQDLLPDLEKMKQRRMIRIIGECKGEPISNVQLYYSKDHPFFNHRAEMHTMHVSQEYRRQGIATAMLRYSLKEAALDEVEIVTCWVDGENIPALNLYQKCGFSEFGRLERGIKKADRFSDYVLMKKDLLK